MGSTDDTPLADVVATLTAKTQSHLRTGAFPDYRQQIAHLLDTGNDLFICRARRGWTYDLLRDQGHPRGLWRRLPEDCAPSPDAPWEAVFDIDADAVRTGLDWAWRGPVERPDGARVMLVLSPGGSDKTVAREFDLKTRNFVPGGFVSPPARQFLAWAGPDELFIAATTDADDATAANLPRTVRLWRRGTPLDQAETVHHCGTEDLFVRGWSIPRHGGPINVFLTQHSLQHSTLTIQEDGASRVLDLATDADKLVTDRYVIWQPQGVGDPDQGCVLIRPLDGHGPDRTLFRPSEHSALTRFMAARDCAILIGHDGPKPWLRLVDLRRSDAPVRGIHLPDRTTHMDVSWFAVDPDGPNEDQGDPRLNVVLQSLLSPPALLRIDPREPGSMSPIVQAREHPSFDVSGLQEHLIQAQSEDGTEIPYHLALPRAARDGPVPIVLTAYGGFGLSADAGYLRLLGAMFLTRGIGCAVAHIRGGGEFGPHWHAAGSGANKARAFEDCAAVARDMVQRGFAALGRVGFYGGSHGGLVGAVMATRYPELFAAIHLQAPVTDLLGFHTSGAGAAWIEEFGDPESPEDAARLRALSPLHNVQNVSVVAYPPVLIDVALNDDRVDPRHGLEFAAALHTAGQDVQLTMRAGGGHGGTARRDEIAEDSAVFVTFFSELLGG